LSLRRTAQQIIELSRWESARALFACRHSLSLTSHIVLRRLVHRGLAPATILDVGANVGQFAVSAAHYFPDSKIHSFEPLPSCVESLRRATRALQNVTVHEVALGDANCSLTMHVNRDSRSSSILSTGATFKKAFGTSIETGTTTVEARTLDSLLSGVPLKRPILLKLDVQGYEHKVIEGATETLGSIDFVLMEASFKPLYEGERTFRDLMMLAEGHGFTFSGPVDFLTTPDGGEILQMDALFERAP
jgi:FkbM family methyltransferase